MAVMTRLTRDSAATLLDVYGRAMVDFSPTSLGIENTNYFITAQRDGTRHERLVLTIIEHGLGPDSFLADLLTRLGDAGLPVPALVRTTLGYAYASYPATASGDGSPVRPVLLCQRLPGLHRQAPSPDDCAAIGRFLARLHRAARPLLAAAPDHPRQAAWLATQSAQLSHHLPPWQVMLLDEAVAYALALMQRADYRALPEAVVHGDLFRDNALFASNGLAGVIDFHHAARHKRLFDLSVAINDWCIDPEWTIDDRRALALLSGYESLAPLTLAEGQLLPALLGYAALTFALSRLQVSTADSARPNKSALPMLLALHNHLRAPWLGRAGRLIAG